MITPEHALKKIISLLSTLPSFKTCPENALGFVLAADVRSRDCLPRFDNSAMDGYAVRSKDCSRATQSHPTSLRLSGTVFAGAPKNKRLQPGCTMKIATGAPLPSGADAVVMQEECVANGKAVLISGRVEKWENVRLKGEEIKKGLIALKKGDLLSAGEISWLCTMGIKNIRVHRKPIVGLLRTGDEVVEFKTTPHLFQTRDAHKLSLTFALQSLDIDLFTPPIVKDHLEKTKKAFLDLYKKCDVILSTGGVSVGTHDLLKESARQLGFRIYFEKVSQKPGKPMVFGKKGGKVWFGLPGNPVAALVCCYLYIIPAIRKMMGSIHCAPQWFHARTGEKYLTHSTRTNFYRGYYNQGIVCFSKNQDSHCLGSFTNANILARVNPSRISGEKGDLVECVFLPR